MGGLGLTNTVGLRSRPCGGKGGWWPDRKEGGIISPQSSKSTVIVHSVRISEMARKTQSRMELRKQAEAAGVGEEEELELDADDDSDDEKPKKRKKSAKKKAPVARVKRTKTKAVIRKRLVWGVFSSSMKEEGRFPYSDKEGAEQKAESLRQKNKREYFVQPIKEPITDPVPAAAPAPAAKGKSPAG